MLLKKLLFHWNFKIYFVLLQSNLVNANMKHTKSITADFFEFFEERLIADEIDPACVYYLDILSSIVIESIYILDVQEGKICYVSPDAPFLCNYPAGEALNLGYDFYQKIIHPTDLTRWKNMHKTVLRYLKEYEEKWDEIDYISCTFRLQRKYSFHPQPVLPQMIYHRMKPVKKDDELRYLICSVGSSTAKEAGNLRMHNKGGLTCKECNFVSRRWKPIDIEPLTEHERAILMLAQQGNSTVKIADYLCKGTSTVRNQIKPIFSKLNVHSMQEAIELASNHLMTYNHEKNSNYLTISHSTSRTKGPEFC